MAVTVLPPAESRIVPLVDHTFRLPTVRELPVLAPDSVDRRTW